MRDFWFEAVVENIEYVKQYKTVHCRWKILNIKQKILFKTLITVRIFAYYANNFELSFHFIFTHCDQTGLTGWIKSVNVATSWTLSSSLSRWSRVKSRHWPPVLILEAHNIHCWRLIRKKDSQLTVLPPSLPVRDHLRELPCPHLRLASPTIKDVWKLIFLSYVKCWGNNFSIFNFFFSVHYKLGKFTGPFNYRE